LNSLEAGKGFIAYVYGFGGVESYGYGVGFNLSTRLDLGGDIHFVKDTILLCIGETKILDAGSQFSSFLWKPGGETTQKIDINKKGYYEVTASTQDGCVLKSGIYAYESKPVINLGKDTTLCKAKSLLDAGAGFSSYLWSTKETTQTIAPKSSGTYSVYALNKYGCPATDTIKVNIGSVPKLNLSKLDTLICGSKSTNVNISADRGTYSLVSANPAVSVKDLSVTVPLYGYYPFTFAATDEYACSSDTTITIGFHQIPSADFNINDTTCYPAVFYAKYLGNAEIDRTRFTWITAGDTLASGIAKDQVQLVLSKDTKNRGLFLKVEEKGCVNTREIKEINVIPDVNFAVSDTIACEHEEVRFAATNSETVTDYLWDWGDGTEEHLNKDALHVFSKSGTYDIQLTVITDKKCSNLIRKKNLVYIAPVPTVNFSMNDNQCIKTGSQTLYDTGTGNDYARYNWDLSGFQTDEVITDPGHTKGPLVFDMKTKLKVDVALQVISKLGCTSEMKRIQLKRKPDFSVFATNISGCTPLTSDFKGITNEPTDPLNFSWDFGTGDIATGSSVTHTFLEPKLSYDIKVAAESSATGCKDTIVKSQWISVYQTPKPQFSVQNPLQCLSEPFVFQAFDNGAGIQYDWDWGDHTKATGLNALHSYSTEGNYDVSLTVTSSKGCSDKLVIEKMVFAAPIPSVGFSIDPEICLNPGRNALNYKGSATGKDQFNWDLSRLDPEEIIQSPGATSGPLVFDLINHPATTISLQVVSQYGCKSENKLLNLKRKPVFSFRSDLKTGCAPLLVTFNAKSVDSVDKIDFQWDFGDGDAKSGADVDHTYLKPDQLFDLEVNVISKTTGCSGLIEEKDYILTYPNPTAGFSMTPDMAYNDQSLVSFLDQSTSALLYDWDFGDGSRSELKNPSHNYERVGIMKVQQHVFNEFNCSATATKDLVIAMNKIYAPNAFSPNAKNIVDREFKLYADGVRTDGYHLKILSRWNDVVFECRNEIKGWDGKMADGKDAQTGSYIWILEFTDFMGKTHKQTGPVMLIY